MGAGWPNYWQIAHLCPGFRQIGTAAQPVKSIYFRCMFLVSNVLPQVRALWAKRYRTCFPERRRNYCTNPLPGVATRTGIPRTWSMREETVTAVRYCPILGCEVVVRITYEVGEGPRPDIVRWF